MGEQENFDLEIVQEATNLTEQNVIKNCMLVITGMTCASC
jgi:hypothetical protein